MKKKYLFLTLCFFIFLTSCSNETDLFVESESHSTLPSLNLRLMRYDDLATVLSNVSSSEQKILLEDGPSLRTIHLRRNQKVNIEEGGHKIDLFSGLLKDSIDAALSPNYATLRFQKNGELISYVASLVSR
ncbi:hypothetical protein POZ03_01035 [Bacteroides uniformis]|uniref:hypothetical protein n=1 Tax=Bacteroides uniformis TaxID=820 RepID=UPI00233F14BD|nr:hypothetical protein [Bacteroides uniformis]MDC1809041.1 hypothetical protein [Bacteroides uniformis]